MVVSVRKQTARDQCVRKGETLSDEEQLTPEQEARMEELRIKWLAIGTCTDPADRPRAEKGVIGAYQMADLEPPKEFYWVMSPREGVKLAAQWIKCNEMRPSGHPDLPEVNEEDCQRALGISCYGQDDAGWHAFYEFLADKLPDKIARLEPQREIAKSCHWWWPFQNGAILCERPEFVAVDDEGRPHNIDRLCRRYRDGLEIYAWHGTCVEPEIIKNPRAITVDMIRNQSDTVLKKAYLELAPTAVAILSGEI